MKVLVFDTETTNVLPKYASLLRKYLSKFPHIVQLSFILYDTKKQTIIDSGDYVIKINEDIRYGMCLERFDYFCKCYFRFEEQ